ncbi:hypothetical protein BN7_5347 [Wickerhamomyces ciferrii]|uniref:Uncharacterized protein n=1 Tax=Wickerhamomyces ciferrii (strain ATCC 14091 / BCRC 22168 / CBS 111 / JCM 3599 / NBRC 0793 / NRRL Y-1031 F-60-10) TaxID=1206466 RepID=K0KRP5_WICCF|nr:uncharacterized protein BN7_5347 [Wickerhamomyces ciferrii]CCH45761.1 hypothetical protein BN7_5347 [Wickerhamomyces ciferrii]
MFSNKVDPKGWNFWTRTIPTLWQISPMIKNGIYSTSYTKLLQLKTNYDHNEKLKLIKSGEYHQSITLNDFSKFIDELEMNKISIDQIGIIISITVILNCSMMVFPNEPRKTLMESGVWKVLNFNYKLMNITERCKVLISGTKFEGLLGVDEIKLTSDSPPNVLFINYLRDYINQNTNGDNEYLQFVYEDALFLLENLIDSAFYMGYEMPFYKFLFKLMAHEGFMKL